MSEASAAEDSPPLTQTRQFWVLLGYAVALGVAGALASLVFMGVIGFGDNWYVVASPGWFGGQWWWIAVTAGGWCRGRAASAGDPAARAHPWPDRRSAGRPGRTAAGAGDRGRLGGVADRRGQSRPGEGVGVHRWRRRHLGVPATQVQCRRLAGEHAGRLWRRLRRAVLQHGHRGHDHHGGRPARRRRFTKALVGAIVASSVSFAIYFAIAGAVFLDAYQVPHYEFEDWQLLAAVPLGLFAAVVATLLALFVKLSAMLFGRLKLPGVVKPTLGGAIFGLVGVALPLTLFTGSDQLNTVLTDAGTLGLGLLVALLIGKMLTFAVSQASGFIGGPIFPALFIGGTAGVSSTRCSPACHSAWRSPACSPPSPEPSSRRRSPWCCSPPSSPRWGHCRPRPS